MKRKWRLDLFGNWKHKTVALWEYCTYADGSKTTRSWQIGYCLYWLNKPWTWFCFYTNGAKKGIDKCLDVNVHLFVLCFTYTNYDYNRVGGK